MKCPVCVQNGLRSKVFIGEARTTLMAGSQYYDEDGVLQTDDPNTTTTEYRCSNDHTWTESAGPKRPIRELLVEPAPPGPAPAPRPRAITDDWNSLMSTTVDGKPLGS